MNITQFMTAIESVYGAYENEFVYSLIVSYVKDNFGEDRYDELFGRIVTKFTTDYKKPLDLAKIAQIKADDCLIKAERIWQDLIPKSPMNDTLITDSVTYQVVAGFGSWASFCRERDDNREWTHKTFISRYTTLSKTGDYVKPTPLTGTVSESLGGDYKTSKIRIIGDHMEGVKLLDEGENNIENYGDFMKKIE